MLYLIYSQSKSIVFTVYEHQCMVPLFSFRTQYKKQDAYTIWVRVKRGNGNGKAEKRVKGGKAEKRVKGGKAEKRVKGGKAEKRVKGGKAEKRVKGGKAEKRVKGGKAEKRVKGRKAEKRVKGGKKRKRRESGKKGKRRKKWKRRKICIQALRLAQPQQNILPGNAFFRSYAYKVSKK